MLSSGNATKSSSFGELAASAFNQFRSALVKFVSIAAIVVLPLALANAVQSIASPLLASNGGAAGQIVVLCCLLPLTLLLSLAVPWMNGALTYNSIERVLGRAHGARESYKTTRPQFGSLWAANFIVQTAVGLLLSPLIFGAYGGGLALALSYGLLPASQFPGMNLADLQNFGAVLAACCLPLGLIFVPVALLVNLNWSMATPAIVGEGLGAMDALKRSTELVKGSRMALLGRFIGFSLLLALVIGLPVLIISLFSLIAAINPDWRDAGTLGGIWSVTLGILTSFAGIFSAPLRSIFGVQNYFDLRARKGQAVAAISTDAAPARPMQIQTPVLPAASPVAALPPGIPGPSANVTITKDMTAAQRIGVYFNQLRVSGPTGPLLRDLGQAYVEVGDLGAALDALSRAREYAPGDPSLAFDLARLHLQRKDTPSAKAALADYMRLETNPENQQRALSNPNFKDLID